MTSTPPAPAGAVHDGHSPVVAGLVAVVVGFSSSFVVVLAGLVAVGATPAQAASGLTTLCVTQALGMAWLSMRHRIPISLAWSTPGAALLATTGGVAGGWSAAVGAFIATGLLIVLTSLIPRLGDLVAAIPASLARAMLAGVLLPLCIAPARALVDSPGAVVPVVGTWLVLLLLAPRWAVPGALAVALATVLLRAHVPLGDLAPSLGWTTPSFSVAAGVGIALPLYVVTMASQNVPGVAVMKGYGYDVPWRETLAVTGIGTIAGAASGAHAINLAAITAAITAGPGAGADTARRWVATVTAAVAYLVLAVASTGLAAMVAAAPDGVMQAAAGLALLATFATALADALADPTDREAVAATVVVAASGVTIGGVGAAFWALLAGGVVRTVVRSRAGLLSRGGTSSSAG